MTSLSTISITYSVTYWETFSFGERSDFVIVENCSGIEEAFEKAAKLLEGKDYTFGCAHEKTN